MKIIQLILAGALAALVLPRTALAANAPKAAKGASAAAVHAIFISASNTKGGVDRKLATYEAELRRNLPFDTFKWIGEGNASLPSGGRATITLAGGHRLELEDDPGDGLRLKVYWMIDSEVQINTTLVLNRGIPAVLGRRPGGEGVVPVIILIAK